MSTTDPEPHALALPALARLILRSNLFVALGVVSLTAYAGWFAGYNPTLELLVVGTGTLLVYNLDHLRDDLRRTRTGAGRPRLNISLRWILVVLSAAGLAASFAQTPPVVFWTAVPSGALGLLYGAPIGGRRLKDIPGAKAWIVSIAVSWAVVAIPLAMRDGVWVLRPDLFAFVVALTALNAHAFDLRDVEIDRASGAWTWASRLGPEAARARLIAAAALATVGTGVWRIAERGSELSFIGHGWEIPLTFAAVTAALVLTRRGVPRPAYGLLFDGLLFLPAVWAIVFS